MKNRTKINAKSKLEKVMPKWCQYDRKWDQNRAQIDPKIDEKNMRKINRTNMAKKSRRSSEDPVKIRKIRHRG